MNSAIALQTIDNAVRCIWDAVERHAQVNKEECQELGWHINDVLFANEEDIEGLSKACAITLSQLIRYVPAADST